MPTAMQGGMYSGIDTKKMVDDLIRLEKEPQRRYKNQQAEIRAQVAALEELRKKTQVLQDSLKDIYTFNNAFELRSFTSTPEGYVEGTATKVAEIGEHSLRVHEMAAKLKIHSKRLKNSETLKAAKIKLGEEIRSFKGGDLKSFRTFLNENFGDKLKAQVVQVNKKQSVLVIEGKTEGHAGILPFEDPDGLLAEMRVYQKPGAVAATPDGKNTVHRPLVFPAATIQAPHAPGVQVGTDAVTIRGSAMFHFPVQVPVVTDHKFTGIQFGAQDTPAGIGSKDNFPTETTLGRKDQLNIKGIQIETYDLSRTREKKQRPQGKQDYGVVIQLDGAGQQKVSLKGKPSPAFIPVEAGVSGVDFYSENAEVVFSDARFVYEKKKKEDGDEMSQDEALAKQKQMYPNIVRPARNAVVEINGIKVERGKNHNLIDLIDGVDLTLKKAGDVSIEAQVAKNSKEAKEQIFAFVKAYNDLLHFARNSSKNGTSRAPGANSEIGVLASNPTVRSLVQGLKTRTGSAYPSVRKPHIKVLATIGISTGAINSDWKEIRSGYLEVREDVLDQMLEQHPRAVKELFVIDTNGDNRDDHGYALRTYRYLKAFTEFPKGLIMATVESRKERIKRLEQAIAKNEESSEKKRDQLRRKFGYMESKIGRQKGVGEMIKNRLTPRNN